MARPQKNNADYFPHDANMRDDPKIKALRARYGLVGYAIWCILLETLTDANNFTLHWDELTQELTAGDMGIELEKLLETIAYLEKLHLIQIENGQLHTTRHRERMAPILELRERKRQWKQEQNTKATAKTQQTGISDGENAQSKVKEIKVNENKLKPSIEGDLRAHAHEDGHSKKPGTLLPDQIHDAIAAWAETDDGIARLKAWKRDTGYSDRVHGPTTGELRKFIAHHLRGAQRDRITSDPVAYFAEQFPGWLSNATQFNRKNTNNVPPKYEPPTHYQQRQPPRTNGSNAAPTTIGDLAGKIITEISPI